MTATKPSLIVAAIVSLSSCNGRAPEQQKTTDQPAPTNRIEIPPGVVNNLGITFEKASRGRLEFWRAVPGQLEVLENRRWTIRAPARARAESIVTRGTVVDTNSTIATLASSDLVGAQRAIELAAHTVEHKTNQVAAATARMKEAEAQVEEAEAFEAAARARLDQLQELGKSGNPLSSRDIIEARRTVTDAGKARLDAAITRDALMFELAHREFEADQAKLEKRERLEALSVLTGLPLEKLTAGSTWRTLDSIVVRAPAPGVVVEVLTSQGETLENGTPLARIFDTRVLRFRGHLPEGDLGTFTAGNRIRIEFPARRIEPLETELLAALPVADPRTRMIHVEAMVPNETGVLAHGISAMAHVLVGRGKQEEVVIPQRCVATDGLEAVVFRRDPEDPNVVIRVPVELGSRSGNLVEILAGVLDGDLVVSDGVQQLKETAHAKAPPGAHIHGDGSVHRDHK